jgi:hypothetical protein
MKYIALAKVSGITPCSENFARCQISASIFSGSAVLCRKSTA